MLKDRKWAERELKKYLRLQDKVPSGEMMPKGNPRMKARGTAEQIMQQRYVATRIYNELFIDPIQHHLYNSNVHDALAELRRGDEIDRGIGESDSPAMPADRLHTWVWSVAAGHWASDAHGAAVWAAGINVNSRLQKKLLRFDLGESKLIQEAFSLKPPEVDKPRLRLCDETNPELYKDRHIGAMNFGTGLYSAVRNPVNHVAPDEHELHPQEALECLSGFSLFARWVERAWVEREPTDDNR